MDEQYMVRKIPQAKISELVSAARKELDVLNHTFTNETATYYLQLKAMVELYDDLQTHAPIHIGEIRLNATSIMKDRDSCISVLNAMRKEIYDLKNQIYNLRAKIEESRT